MYRVRIYNQIAKKGLDTFDSKDVVVAKALDHPQAILLRSHKLQTEEIEPSVLAIARAGAGINNIPLSYCTEQGIVVFNTPGANANSVKELVLAALLLSSRDVIGGVNFVSNLNENDAEQFDYVVESNKKQFKGKELSKRTLGIIGLGSIGSAVAKAALDLGMKVVGYDPALSIEAAWSLPSQVKRMDQLDSLYEVSDYVTLHVPVLPQTRNLINTESFKHFQRGTALLNFSRGEIVNDASVLEALSSELLSYYFTDFPDRIFMGNSRVYATPHLGASTMEAEENCAIMAAEQLDEFIRFGNIKNSVNFPDVRLDSNAQYRIAVANRNVPGLLGELMSVLADKNINVIDMINKSRGDVAYNLIDIDAKPTIGLIETINSIKDILSLRGLNLKF
ncbi:MAG: phosphoglycerate dehydrogenase [Pseudomonadales bacterium]|nr:phosphoglycerate dehydrogenase [Pseudomonadales bacterium]HAO55872.1 3-phosphoglycerate dehydrogenase [Gammaproteobacteria bacterium]|tara:strand:+ start:358 stop:1536 length:1179 start_codon:yes stop_codon:yes gene_type:complete